MTTPTWYSNSPPTPHRPRGLQWLLVLLRGVPIVVVLLLGLLIHTALRLIEKPLNGPRRPITPFVTQTVCKAVLRLLGLRVTRVGTVMNEAGAVLANHSSWLDILVLNAGQRITFVSKAEVAGWPGIGWLARATGTLFIARDRRDAAKHVRQMQDRLGAGAQLLFFPEGTSSDNQQVLSFKTTLFASFLTPNLHDTALQPVTVTYHAPKGRDPRTYGWWGDMDLGPHLLDMLSLWPHGSVTVTYHPPQSARAYDNRKDMARALETQVRSAHHSMAE